MIKKNGVKYEVGDAVLSGGKKYYQVFKCLYDDFLDDEACLAYHYPQFKLKSGKYLVIRFSKQEIPCEYFETKEDAEKYCLVNANVIEEDVGDRAVINIEDLEKQRKEWW